MRDIAEALVRLLDYQRRRTAGGKCHVHGLVKLVQIDNLEPNGRRQSLRRYSQYPLQGRRITGRLCLMQCELLADHS